MGFIAPDKIQYHFHFRIINNLTRDNFMKFYIRLILNMVNKIRHRGTSRIRKIEIVNFRFRIKMITLVSLII